MWLSTRHGQHQRLALIIGLIVALTAVLAVPATAAISECGVTNKSTGAKYTQLRPAVKAAKAGQTLDVKGVCHGSASIGKDLTIKGVRTQTSGRATLDGDNNGPVVSVLGGTTVTIKSLTIRGGGRWASGVDNDGTLTLANVVVEGNKQGGVSNDGALSLTGRSRVTGNAADSGGGVDNDGALWLYDSSSISGNSANEGGGVSNYGGILTLSGSSSISGNTATNGGGVWGYGSMVLNDAASIFGNTAYAEGGGAHFEDLITMNGSSSIHSNTAASGGGLVAWSPLDLTGAVCGVNVYGNAPDDCHFEFP